MTTGALGAPSPNSLSFDSYSSVSGPVSDSSRRTGALGRSSIVGGLSDHEEMYGEEGEEWRLSPVKGRQRLNSNVCVLFFFIRWVIDIVQSLVQVKETKGGKAKAPPKKNRNISLPDECHENDVWSTHVVGSMLMWASCHCNPWSIDDKETAHALGIICPVYYTPETVAALSLDDPDCAAVQIVSQLPCF